MALEVKSPRANAGDARDMSLIPELGRSPGIGNGNLFQYPCLEKVHGQKSLVGSAVHRVAELGMTGQLTLRRKKLPYK